MDQQHKVEVKYDDRPVGERINEEGRDLKKRADEKGEELKEDFKGAARRMEGKLTDDEGLKREHDKSTLEKMGDSIKETGEWVGEKIHEGAVKVGLVKDEGEHK